MYCTYEPKNVVYTLLYEYYECTVLHRTYPEAKQGVIIVNSVFRKILYKKSAFLYVLPMFVVYCTWYNNHDGHTQRIQLRPYLL